MLRIVFVSLTIVLILVYGLACLTPLVSPARWVGMGFLALAFPVLLLLLLVLAVTWFFIRKKTAWVFLLLLACGSWHIVHLFGFHSGKFTVARPAGTVRIMGWNVQGFATREKYLDSFNSVRHRLFRYIQQQQPDILCLQDFMEYYHPSLPSNINLNDKNVAINKWQQKSETFDFTKEDSAPDMEFSEVIWYAVKGEKFLFPGPRRSAFLKVREEEDDDD